MARDPLSFFGVWYWPEDGDGDACYTAVCNNDHYGCTKGFLRYENVKHPSNWIDVKVELLIGPKVIVEWSK